MKYLDIPPEQEPEVYKILKTLITQSSTLAASVDSKIVPKIKQFLFENDSASKNIIKGLESKLVKRLKFEK